MGEKQEMVKYLWGITCTRLTIIVMNMDSEIENVSVHILLHLNDVQRKHLIFLEEPVLKGRDQKAHSFPVHRVAGKGESDSIEIVVGTNCSKRNGWRGEKRGSVSDDYDR